MEQWHWYHTVLLIFCWSMIPAAFGLRAWQDRQWKKKFGEPHPRLKGK